MSQGTRFPMTYHYMHPCNNIIITVCIINVLHFEKVSFFGNTLCKVMHDNLKRLNRFLAAWVYLKNTLLRCLQIDRRFLCQAAMLIHPTKVTNRNTVVWFWPPMWSRSDKHPVIFLRVTDISSAYEALPGVWQTDCIVNHLLWCVSNNPVNPGMLEMVDKTHKGNDNSYERDNRAKVTEFFFLLFLPPQLVCFEKTNIRNKKTGLLIESRQTLMFFLLISNWKHKRLISKTVVIIKSSVKRHNWTKHGVSLEQTNTHKKQLYNAANGPQLHREDKK